MSASEKEHPLHPCTVLRVVLVTEMAVIGTSVLQGGIFILLARSPVAIPLFCLF